MRDIIKKTLQLGPPQHLCLFTLTDEFSPLCCDVEIERRFLLWDRRIVKSTRCHNLWISSSHNQTLFLLRVRPIASDVFMVCIPGTETRIGGRA